LSEVKKIEEIFEKTVAEFNATFEFQTEFGCLAYQVNEEDPVVQKFETACRKLGYETKLIETFGGSDNNNFIRNGITGIVLACGMNEVHSVMNILISKSWLNAVILFLSC
jgi:tripeptide aminopeptidase